MSKRERHPVRQTDFWTRTHAEIATDRETRLADLPPSTLDIPPPPPVVWQNFLRNLAHAQAVAADAKLPRANLYGAIVATMAAIDLLRQGEKPEVADPLAEPLRILLQALYDVSVGTKPPLFVPNMTSKAGDSLRRTTIEHVAALAVQELLEAGSTLAQAHKRVARDLAGLGVKSRDGADLAKTVKNWRQEQMKPASRQDFDGRLAIWRAQYAAAAGHEGTPAQRADVLLRMLKGGNSEMTRVHFRT